MKRLAMTLSVLAAVCAVSTPAVANEAMMKAKGCVACHKVDGKLIGPSYKDVAAKYSASDVDALVTTVLEGTVGKPKKWKEASGVMTPNKGKLTPEEAKQMVNWILSLK